VRIGNNIVPARVAAVSTVPGHSTAVIIAEEFSSAAMRKRIRDFADPWLIDTATYAPNARLQTLATKLSVDPGNQSNVAARASGAIATIRASVAYVSHHRGKSRVRRLASLLHDKPAALLRAHTCRLLTCGIAPSCNI
jgi:hypothetical protein